MCSNCLLFFNGIRNLNLKFEFLAGFYQRRFLFFSPTWSGIWICSRFWTPRGFQTPRLAAPLVWRRLLCSGELTTHSILNLWAYTTPARSWVWRGRRYITIRSSQHHQIKTRRNNILCLLSVRLSARWIISISLGPRREETRAPFSLYCRTMGCVLAVPNAFGSN